MKRLITLLAAVLALQTVLVLSLSWPEKATQRASQKLLAAGTLGEIDVLDISGKDGMVRLERQAGTWVIPGYFKLPADKSLVEQLVSKLEALQIGLPVTQAEDAHARLGVGDKAPERRIQWSSAGKGVTSLYLGNTTSRGRSYGRLSGQSAVFDLSMAAYDAPASPTEWMNKLVVAVPKEAFQSVSLPSRNLNEDTQQRFATALAALRVNSVLGSSVLPDYGLSKPEMKFSVKMQSGAVREYVIGPMDRNNIRFALQVSDRAEIFEIDGAQVRDLREAIDPPKAPPKPTT